MLHKLLIDIREIKLRVTELFQIVNIASKLSYNCIESAALLVVKVSLSFALFKLPSFSALIVLVNVYYICVKLLHLLFVELHKAFRLTSRCRKWLVVQYKVLH